MVKKKKASQQAPGAVPKKAKAKKTKNQRASPSKSRGRPIHADVPTEHYFLLIDGSAIRGLEELADAFDQMSDDVFYYHVNEFKNDFANWIRDIFDEKELAEHIELAKSIEHAHIAVLRHIIKQLKKV
ncbi:MAG: hypothetical protein GXP63_04845 [DPANN group archaeon]|nr:hypothetical protein [DPANN group archaeon]